MLNEEGQDLLRARGKRALDTIDDELTPAPEMVSTTLRPSRRPALRVHTIWVSITDHEREGGAAAGRAGRVGG